MHRPGGQIQTLRASSLSATCRRGGHQAQIFGAQNRLRVLMGLHLLKLNITVLAQVCLLPNVVAFHRRRQPRSAVRRGASRSLSRMVSFMFPSLDFWSPMTGSHLAIDSRNRDHVVGPSDRCLARSQPELSPEDCCVGVLMSRILPPIPELDGLIRHWGWFYSWMIGSWEFWGKLLARVMTSSENSINYVAVKKLQVKP